MFITDLSDFFSVFRLMFLSYLYLYFNMHILFNDFNKTHLISESVNVSKVNMLFKAR